MSGTGERTGEHASKINLGPESVQSGFLSYVNCPNFYCGGTESVIEKPALAQINATGDRIPESTNIDRTKLLALAFRDPANASSSHTTSPRHPRISRLTSHNQ